MKECAMECSQSSFWDFWRHNLISVLRYLWQNAGRVDRSQCKSSIGSVLCNHLVALPRLVSPHRWDSPGEGRLATYLLSFLFVEEILVNRLYASDLLNFVLYAVGFILAFYDSICCLRMKKCLFLVPSLHIHVFFPSLSILLLNRLASWSS